MKKPLFTISLIIFLATGFFFLNRFAAAGLEHDVSGWAWSENIGWISFNQSDLSDCPRGECRARVDFDSGQISGWARVLSYNGWLSLSGLAEPSVTTYTLLVDKEGQGSGIITGIPVGIDCGTDCQAEFEENTPVTLSASPASGSLFAGWSEDCSGLGDCILTMDGNKTAVATFNLIPACLELNEPCNNNSDCCSGHCYRDEDGDGYHAPSGKKYCQTNASLGEDCCDTDNQVFPGQTAWFTQPNECGDFDYNCSGTEEKDRDYCSRVTSCSIYGASTACCNGCAGFGASGTTNYYDCGEYRCGYCRARWYTATCSMSAYWYWYRPGATAATYGYAQSSLIYVPSSGCRTCRCR